MASRASEQTVVRIDGEAIVLTHDRQALPVALRIDGVDLPREAMSADLELEITGMTDDEIAGRMTCVNGDAAAPACPATFRARIVT